MFPQVILMEAQGMELPFRGVDLESHSDRVVAAQIYLVHFLSRLTGLSNPKKYASLLYKTR
jgi:hypothetical protein